MNALKAEGARAFILDLRWNPGGLLEQAVEVSDLFVDEGTLVPPSRAVTVRRAAPAAATARPRCRRCWSTRARPRRRRSSPARSRTSISADRRHPHLRQGLGAAALPQRGRRHDAQAHRRAVLGRPAIARSRAWASSPTSRSSACTCPTRTTRRPTWSACSRRPVRGARRTRRALTSTYAKDDDKPTYELSFLFEKPKDKTATPGAPTPEEEEAGRR